MENKGLEYEKIGDKLSQSSCLGNSTDKIEEASEYYEKAAKAYFISKQYDNSLNCYKKAIEMDVSIKNYFEAALHCADACKIAKKSRTPQESNQLLKCAAEYYLESGRFESVGKCFMELGDLLEEESKYEEAIEAYEKSIEYYSGNKIYIAQARSKIAVCLAKTKQYFKASQMFESLAVDSLHSRSQYQTVGYFFQAGICLLVADSVGAEIALEKWFNQSNEFASSTNYACLSGLIKTVIEQDEEGFNTALLKYGYIIKEGWMISALKEVKNSFKRESLE